MANRRTAIFVRAYDLPKHFDQVALNPKLTSEEKIRILVLLQHVWTDGKQILSEPVAADQLEAEIQAFRAEIEGRIAEAA